MPDLYERLAAQIGGDDDQPAGVSPLDIVDLPRAQRQIMVGLLRDSTAAMSGITLDALREKLAGDEGLAEALNGLTNHGWLIRLGEPPNVRYKVNLSRRRGKKLSANLWASLADHLAASQGEGRGEDSDHPGPHFPTLSDW